jgi:hypothetical protein
MIYHSLRGNNCQNLPLFQWAENQRITTQLNQRYRHIVGRYHISPGMASAIANNLPGGCYE